MERQVLEREIGSIQIENDRIRVVEVHLPDAEVEAFLTSMDPVSIIQFNHQPDAVGEIQWFARLGDRILAYAFLMPHGSLLTVEFRCIVHPDYRLKGIGRLMGALATDLAIRHRCRFIYSSFTKDNEGARAIAGLSGFDFEEPEHGNIKVFKELK